ncbi:MAG: patatin-like phospholipase family protein [Candidatus Methylacidiphilales bacterium]|nr:patatin-like phospholipase family protein [Roseimicrobium sp.]
MPTEFPESSKENAESHTSPLVSEPVGDGANESENPVLENQIALCLSGGGFRATVYHLGTLIRLNEAGILRKIRRISSVSGGSITAARLGLKWNHLTWDDKGRATNLKTEVVNPVLKLASRNVDIPSITAGLLWFGTVSDYIVDAYKELFGDATLQDLPEDGKGPRFVINATNVQSAALWRFSRPYMGDYLTGLYRHPKVSLALAVTASSAFPPVLSPVQFAPEGAVDPATVVLKDERFRDKIFLTDGGSYDNLGLETAWKRCSVVLVSDGGLKWGYDPEPATDWAQHMYRVLSLIDNQVRSLRLRQLFDAFDNPHDLHSGCYWGIGTLPSTYKNLQDPLPFTDEQAKEAASIATRLSKLSEEEQHNLVNSGYVTCDASLRLRGSSGKTLDAFNHHGIHIEKPVGLPYP